MRARRGIYLWVSWVFQSSPINQWKQNTKYWADCKSDQFVYGCKKGKTDSHFFLVDVDPKFYRHGDDKWHTLNTVLVSLSHDLIENEDKFKPKVRLQKARNKLLGIINEILKEYPDATMFFELDNFRLIQNATIK